MKYFKNIGILVLLFVAAFGLICGIGYCLYSGEWLYAIGVAVLGALCVPFGIKLFKKMNE